MKILIVDDERRARNRLAKMMDELDDVEVVGEAEHGLEALERIAELQPDVVLLDVQMPGLTGLDVATELAAGASPLVIFVTAYDQYALQAFEVSATDYLLKPVTEERLAKALARAREALHSRTAAQIAMQQLQRLASTIDRQRPQFLPRLVGRRAQKLQVLPIETVQAIVADRELIFALTADGRYLLSQTLRDLEARLDPAHFLRVHKQTIVNLGSVAEIDPVPKGGAVVRLRNGATIEVSRRYANLFRERLAL